MRDYVFYQIDVFAEQRFGGNPVAVFPAATDLSDEEMQGIAFELNLSDTIFVIPDAASPGGNTIRIFTPVQELFSGEHPTIATQYLLAKLGKMKMDENPSRAVQVVGNQDLPLAVYHTNGEIDKVAVQQGEPRFLKYVDDLEILAQALCCNVSDFDLDFAMPQVVSTGIPCIMVPLKSLRALGELGLEVGALRELCNGHGCEMAYAFTLNETLRPGSNAQCRFFSGHLLFELAASGSAASALGAFLVAHGLGDESGITNFVIDQGDFLGRPSRMYVTMDEKNSEQGMRVEVAGKCRQVFQATMRI